jgi:hypothetical protein
VLSLSRSRAGARIRFTSRLTWLALLSAVGLLATFVAAKTLPASSYPKSEKKAPALRWDPPRVDARVPSLSTTPPCLLPDVLKQAGQRAQELVDHLQNFIAHEQIRYKQTDSLGPQGMSIVTGTQPTRSGQSGQPEISLTARFDYLVDFGEKSDPLNIHETRTRLDVADDRHLGEILDKGLPALALIFYPALQNDYEMRCEGSAEWNNHSAWVVYFSQIKGKRSRTITMETPTEVHPSHRNATEIRTLSIKGRAWIAAESGQVIHLETNLVERIPMIELEENAISVDYGPVQFQSQNGEIWLPQFAVAYTDYAKRRMIIEHTFADFQLFSVQTQDLIKQPKDH